MKTEVTYFLPVTRVRLEATMTRLTDTLEPTNAKPEASSWSAELVTVADTYQPRTLAVESGPLFDYGLKLALTEDGRLRSAGVESTGDAGKMLASAAGLAVSIASASVFRLPLPGPPMTQVQTKGGSGEPARETELSPVEAAYAKECPSEAQHLQGLQAEQQLVLTELTAARKNYLTAGDPSKKEAWEHYRRVGVLVADTTAELGRAKALFDAWRHTKQSTVEYAVAATVELVSLPLLTRLSGGAVDLEWGTGVEPGLVNGFFSQTGYVMARTTPEEWPTRSAIPTDGVAGAAVLWMRRPRSVGLCCVHRGEDGVVRMIEDRRELIMDAACAEVRVPVRKSWFARRKTSVELSALGALTGVELGGDAAAAGVTVGVSGAGTAALAALESAQKARAALSQLGAAGEENELARLKREVAIREQHLLAAGQAATAAEYAKLEASKQQVAIAEAEAKLRGDR